MARVLTTARAAFGRAFFAVLVWLGLVLGAAPIEAQDWPNAPLTFGGDRITLAGTATITVGTDDRGFFNYTDYERSALRLVRFDVIATARANAHVSFLAELRAEGDSAAGNWSGEAYAAYLRVKPWTARSFEVHAGRIPTAFGGFSRRVYGYENLLIGYPLAYQYLTSLRADAVPRSADDLVAMRGRGWYAHYPVGSDYWEHGVPQVSVFRYDTGVLAKGALSSGRVEMLASLTAGTLSNPGLGDENGAPQLAARVVVNPAPAFSFGVSAARGAFLDQSVRDELPSPENSRQYRQSAFGADVELSRGYWLVRSEIVTTAWQLPALEPPLIDGPVRATAWLTEGRYKLAPGLYAAARFDRMIFSRIESSIGPTEWDANLSRVEAGLGYSLRRNVMLKASYQHNSRDGGRVRVSDLAAGQVVLWF
jgi:hypothetical protein